MKRIVPMLILSIVLVSTFVWYYQSNNVNQKFDANREVSNVQTEKSILLYPLSGDVSFKATPDSDSQKVTESPTIIPNQAIVHTGIGKASVLLPDNSSISLENNTEITVNYSEKSISIYQNMGATYHRVEKLLTGSTYQVQTAGTLAAVRGTKFAVKYDEKSKKTKIAVTENKVEVATIPKSVNGAQLPKMESMLVEAGKTISVETLTVITPQKPSAMQIVDTVKDVDMRTYVEEQKKVDAQLETIKKEVNDPIEFRKEIKRVLFDDIKEEDSLKTTEKSNEDVKKEEPKNTDEVNRDVPVKTEEVPVVKREVVVPPTETVKPVVDDTSVVVKIGEEEFFNAFEPMFIKYFYVDDADTLCDLKVTPEGRVQAVTLFAKSKGYPFTKITLLSFAQEINNYCSTRDKDVKVKLQSRFDDEYPF